MGHGPHEPRKWPPETPDLKNNLQAPRNMVSKTTKTPPFCLHAPHFGLQ